MTAHCIFTLQKTVYSNANKSLHIAFIPLLWKTEKCSLLLVFGSGFNQNKTVFFQYLKTNILGVIDLEL